MTDTTSTSSLGAYNFKTPTYAGAYHIGEGPTISFSITKKPSAWHRFWMRVCLGWLWVDAADEYKNWNDSVGAL